MRKIALLLFLGFGLTVSAQEPILDAWIMNLNGKTASYYENVGTMQNPNYVLQMSSDSADILELCYTTDTVWVRCEGMTNDMGVFTNPGTPSAQGYVWRFPRNPSQGTGNDPVVDVFAIGCLLNGIPMFGKGDARSWDPTGQQNSNQGQGVWNGDAWYSEGNTLDTAFAAHPQQQGAYHTHATPFRLYSDPSTSHSPIVGFAWDGYPVYGPFGYSTGMDSMSTVKRMMSSYALRDTMTKRHSLPDGTSLSANQYGPDVDGTHPLGEYIEDYMFVQGSGDLDEHNGRMCVTPEYPNGTYAYFVTTDSVGGPAFPYYLGSTYYGTPDSDNSSPQANITIPGNATCGLVSVADQVLTEFKVYPNPAREAFMVYVPGNTTGLDVEIYDAIGKLVYSKTMESGLIEVPVDGWQNGIYHCTIKNSDVKMNRTVIVAND